MARVANITFACENPTALAEFWCAVLGYELDRVEGELAEALLAAGMTQADLEGECAAFDPSGAGPRLYFQRKQKTPTTTAPIHSTSRSVPATIAKRSCAASSSSARASWRRSPGASAASARRGRSCGIPKGTRSACSRRAADELPVATGRAVTLSRHPLTSGRSPASDADGCQGTRRDGTEPLGVRNAQMTQLCASIVTDSLRLVP